MEVGAVIGAVSADHVVREEPQPGDVIILLGGPAVQCLRDYIRQKKEGKNPVFKAKDIQLKDKTDFWN